MSSWRVGVASPRSSRRQATTSSCRRRVETREPPSLRGSFLQVRGANDLALRRRQRFVHLHRGLGPALSQHDASGHPGKGMQGGLDVFITPKHLHVRRPSETPPQKLAGGVFIGRSGAGDSLLFNFTRERRDTIHRTLSRKLGRGYFNHSVALRQRLARPLENCSRRLQQSEPIAASTHLQGCRITH